MTPGRCSIFAASSYRTRRGGQRAQPCHIAQIAWKILRFATRRHGEVRASHRTLVRMFPNHHLNSLSPLSTSGGHGFQSNSIPIATAGEAA